jgi:hypothetical protein
MAKATNPTITINPMGLVPGLGEDKFAVAAHRQARDSLRVPCLEKQFEY